MTDAPSRPLPPLALRLLLVLLPLVSLPLAGCEGGCRGDATPRLRVGYSSLTPLHTALGEALKHGDFMAQNGLSGEFTPYERGKDQDRAAARGGVDVTFTCEVPAMVHLHKLPGLTIAGSPGELGEIALVVPADSPHRTVASLRGARLLVQGGASARMLAERWLAGAGLDEPGAVTVRHHRGHPREADQPLSRGEVDAAVYWDPWLSRFSARRHLRTIARAPFWSLSAVYHPRRPRQTLQAYHRALLQALRWVAAHPEQAAAQAAEVSPLSAAEILTVLRKNRFVAGKEPPSLELTPAVRRRLDACAAQARALGAVPESFTLAPRLKPELALDP